MQKIYKKIIKIGFHSAISDAIKQYVINHYFYSFKPVESSEYDYYIAMESIYWTKDNMIEFLSSRKNSIRIMLCGECIYPDMNLFDYAIVSRDSDVVSDRFLYIPYENYNIPFLFDSYSELDDSKKNKSPQEILKSKTKFCNFIYSNSQAHPMRDELFYSISKYKQVDSLGSHLNNVQIPDTRNDQNWGKISVQLKQPYKFSISAENAKFPGYCSEKIVTSMMANTIPIYFGDPKINEQFNPKSFINVNDFDSLDSLVQRIKEIDENDDLYCEIMNQPWRLSWQIEKFEEDTEKFYMEFNRIFELDLKTAKRRPEGTWPDKIYPDFFIGNKEKYNYLKKIFRFMK